MNGDSLRNHHFGTGLSKKSKEPSPRKKMIPTTYPKQIILVQLAWTQIKTMQQVLIFSIDLYEEIKPSYNPGQEESI